MIPGKYNMVCPQGSTFNQQLTYIIDDVAVDLTAYTARMKVKEKHTSTSSKFNLNTENDGIVLGGSLGTIVLFISDTDTAACTAKEYVYDLEIVSSSNIVTRLIEGKFIVTPEVTR